MANDATTQSARMLLNLVREREITALEVVTAFLDKIDSINPKLNAFCTVLHESALEAAALADERMERGLPLGQLHGLPIALKDLTPTGGVRTTRGSRLFENAIPDKDAELVKRLKKAGAIIIGKTNTPEFGHKGETNNLVFGQIRIPAAMCGVFGFKPSYGRVPDVAGPFSSHTPFFHNGPLARSVTDAALLYQAMAGLDVPDPFSVSTQGNILDTLDQGVDGLRIAYSPDLGSFQESEEVSRVCAHAVQAFEQLGCVVSEVDIDFGPDLEASFFALWCAKLATFYAELPEQQLALFEPVVQNLIERGKGLSAVAVGKANLTREAVWHALNRVFETHDLLVCPTTAVSAFPINDGPPSSINGTKIDPLLGWFLTYPINFTGNPAASIPCGFSRDGLPIGMQIIGRRLDDDVVLRASRSFERVAPWRKIARAEQL